MIQRLIETVRRSASDRAKALAYLAEKSDSSFREILKEYDTFAAHMEHISEPAILIGTAKTALGNEVSLRIGTRESHAHWLVQGGTGSGKTSFVTGVFVSALGQGDPVGIVDFKSGLFDTAIRWFAALAYRMETGQKTFIQNLAVVNPFADALVPLNVCRPISGTTQEVQSYNVSLSLSRLFSSDLGFQMENILRHLLLLLMEANLSLVEAPEVLQQDLLRDILVQRSAIPAVKEFFGRTYPSVPQSSKNALLSRIQSLLLPENLRLMLGADELIDFKGILDRGDPLLIFLGKGAEVPEEQVDLVGSLVLQLLFQAAYSSASGKRRPYQIILDEFFHLLDAPALEKRFDTALTTLRSFGVTLSLVMHNFSQVPVSLRDSILNNCDFMAIFRTYARNAQYFGDFLPELDPEIVAESLRTSGRLPAKQEVRAQLLERLQRLPDRHCYWYDKRKPYRGVLVRVPDLSTPHRLAGISETALEQFMDREGLFLGGCALPKDTLRAQIEARRIRLRELVRPPINMVSNSQKPPDDRDLNTKDKKRRPRLG